jgi:hypothetical protein
MKDQLQDLVQHINVGDIDLIKIVGSEKDTLISAASENKTLILLGQFKDPIAEFIGTFGMPNLNKLKTILGFDEYDDTAKIVVTRKDEDPENIRFESKSGDFINTYRLMGKNLIQEKIKDIKFKGVNWNIEFEPQTVSIQKLKKQAMANSEELHFMMKTENNNLKIYFGDHSTHSGNFVFESQVKGSITQPKFWPVKTFLAIMDVVGDKTIKINDQIIQITVDSGIAVYNYFLPAQSK